MVSFPVPSQVPGLDKATIDIAASLRAMPDVDCGFGKGVVYLVCISKPTNSLLPLYLPVASAEVEGRVNYIKTVSAFTGYNGIIYACYLAVGTYALDFRVRKADVDFGMGKGQWSDWKSPPKTLITPLGMAYERVLVFEGKVDIPCTSGSFPINQSFSQGVPKPQVWSSPLAINAPGYGSVSAAGMPFTIYINGTEIGSGTMTGNQLIFTSIKPVTDIPEISSLLGKSVEIKAVIKFGTCEWVGTTTLSLPALVCPPGEVFDPITKTCIKIVCPLGEVFDPITKTCKPIKIVCPPGEVFDPITKTCKPIPTEVCAIGEEKTISCPDGSTIVVARCEKDPTTGRNRFVPTGKACPPPELGKTAKILVYPEGAPLEAYEGMDVTITAGVMCGAVPSNGETATFIVDGEKTVSGTTSAGFVSFKWKATVEPSRTHKICVSVPKSTQCPKYGEARDCKTITVSRVIPGIEEQLRIEREAYQSGLEALRQERERIRTLPLPAISAAPTAPTIPGIPGVPIPTAPGITVPTTPTVPEAPKPGKISIPSVGTPPGYEFPVIIYIDGSRMGSPPISIDADPGMHTVRVELKGFPTIYQKINVTAGETTSLTDLTFL